MGWDMKKIDDFFEKIDKRVDANCSGFFIFLRHYFVVFSSTILSLMMLISLFKFYYNKPYFTAAVITNDVRNLDSVLACIDGKCSIMRVANNKIQLDFLSIKKIDDSVGRGMALAYPEKWQGPYLKASPLLQERHYELVKAKDGYFIVPGSGVSLPNGLTVGKDFAFDEKTEIAPMLRPGGKLSYKGILLAKKVSFKIGDSNYHQFRLKDSTINELNNLVKEFNEAMAFTRNFDLYLLGKVAV